MTSRERVVAAINHREPDRVPVDIGGTFVTGIHMDAYCEIVKRLGLSLLPPRVIDQFMMTAEVDIPIANWLTADVVGVEHFSHNWGYFNKDWHIWNTNKGNDVLIPGMMQPEKDSRGYTLIRDSSGELCAQMSPDGQYFDRVADMQLSEDFVFADPAEWAASLPIYTDEVLRLYEQRAEFYYKNTDFAVNGAYCDRNLFTTGITAGHNLTDWMCLIVMEPDYVKSIVEAQTEWMLKNLKLYLEATGKYIETVIIQTGDFGTQRCEMISPASFADIFAPAFKKVNDYVHSTVRAKTFYHSCGSIRNILGMMIDAGVDIINPVQTSAAGMDPAELKAEFGDRVVFWGGGADTQHTLPNGTPEEVRAEVAERMRIFKPGGGFVFSQIHNLQSDIPFENVEAMVEAIKEFGRY